jgi:hypothetical protein
MRVRHLRLLSLNALRGRIVQIQAEDGHTSRRNARIVRNSRRLFSDYFDAIALVENIKGFGLVKIELATK